MTKEILLTKHQFALIDDEDFDRVNQYSWSVIYKPNRQTKYYARRSVYTSRNCSPITIMMHRYILGLTDTEILVDHKDCNGLNNTKNNLRVCCSRSNSQHRPAQLNAISSFKGVTIDREHNLWRARITYKGKTISIGRYHTEIEAAQAYDYTAVKLFGEFATLNFPNFDYTNFVPKTKRKVYSYA